jgi:hypothetical protein
MTVSGCKDSGELDYETPELEIHRLSAIVMAGATGGGDSGFTGFLMTSTGGKEGEEEPSGYEDDPIGRDW